MFDDYPDLDDEEREHSHRRGIGQLSGATVSLHMGTRGDMVRAINLLLGCHRHHFAVVSEQSVLMCSPLAVRCLQSKGMIRP